MAESRTLEIVLKAKDLVSKSLKPLSETIKRVGEISSKAFAAARKGASAAASAIRLLAKPLAIISGLLGGLSIAGFGVLVKQAAEFGARISDVSERLGLSTEFLSEFEYVARRTGVNVGAVGIGFQRLTRRLSEFRKTGAGAAAAGLQLLGDDIVNAVKAGGSLEDLLPKLADAFANLESEQDKVRAAFGLFDSEGVSFVQFLQLGSTEIARLREEAQKLGVSLDSVAAGKAADFDDALENLGEAFRGLKFQVALQFFDNLADGVRRATDFIVKNREAIVAFAAKASELGGSVIRAIGAAFTDQGARNALFNLVEGTAEYVFSRMGDVAAFSFGNSFKAGYLNAVASAVDLVNVTVPTPFGRKGVLDSVVSELRGGASGFRDLDFTAVEEFDRRGKEARQELGNLAEAFLAYGKAAEKGNTETERAVESFEKAVPVVEEFKEAIDASAFVRFAEGFSEEAAKIEEFFEEAVNIGRRAAGDLHRAFSDNFFKATQREFQSFAQFFKSLFKDIVDSILRILSDALASQIVSSFAKLLGSAFGGIGGGGAGGANAVGAFLGGIPSSGGSSGILGGSAGGGDELLQSISQSSSAAAPSGGGRNVVINIRAVDTRSFVDALQRDPDGVINVIASGISRNNNARVALRGAIG